LGRKLPLIVAIGLQAIAGALSAFSPWFGGFLLARFVMAVATGGTMIISFVLGRQAYCCFCV
jgi:chromosome transmission fidelity protein 4